jgi:hypothetical protein
MFTMLPRWNGMFRLKPSARKGGISKQKVFNNNKT